MEESQPRVVVFSLELEDPTAWRGLEDLQCGRLLGVPGVVLTASVRPDGANRLRAGANGCAAFVGSARIRAEGGAVRCSRADHHAAC